MTLSAFKAEKDFLEEVSALRDSLLHEIETHKFGLDRSPAAIRERRKRVLNGDFSFFAYTYFPHHIRGEPSQFQEDFCQRFPKLLSSPYGVREWFKAPRGECKSSLLTKIGPVWIEVQSLLQKANIRAEVGIKDAPDFNDYVIFLGAETRLPTKLLEVVKIELTLNPVLATDFPEIAGRGKVWKIGEIVTKNNVRMESFGAEQAIRGTFNVASRPKVLLGDDLITDKEAKSPTERDNRWDWLGKAIDYLGPPDGSVKFLCAGTALNKDDPISRAMHEVGHIVHEYKAVEKLPNRMDLWEKCSEIMLNEDKLAIDKASKKGEVLPDTKLPSHLFYLKNKKKMEAGAVTSWPSVRSLYWLMRQRTKNKKSFDSEMQGEPRSDEDRVFYTYNFWVQRLQHWIMYGACDPSMGKGMASHPSALLVGGWDQKINKLHVITADIKRRVPSKLEADMLRLQIEHDIILWAFENNNAYEHMRKTFIAAALAKSIRLTLRGVTASIPPEIRIDSLEPHITDAEPDILLHQSLIQLNEQLNDWPEKQSHHHYDGLVALHLLWMVASTGAQGLPRIVTRNQHQQMTDQLGGMSNGQ